MVTSMVSMWVFRIGMSYAGRVAGHGLVRLTAMQIDWAMRSLVFACVFFWAHNGKRRGSSKRGVVPAPAL